MAGVPPIKMIQTLVIQESSSLIKKRMARAMQKEVNRVFKKAVGFVKVDLKADVSGWIFQSPEMQSLMTGTLRGDFGIIDPAPKVMTIAASIQESVEVRWSPVDGSLRGSPLVVEVQPSHLLNVLGAIPPIVTENGYSLDWIEWLLLKGDSPVVFDYHVEEGPFGRTGDAHMVAGGTYSVGRADPTYTGTVDDNFITRALQGKESEIERLIANSLERAM